MAVAAVIGIGTTIALAATTEEDAAPESAVLDWQAALDEAQQGNDALLALQTLKQAFTTDVAPILAMARKRAGGAIDPVGAYRASGYRQRKAEERPAVEGRSAGIV